MKKITILSIAFMFVAFFSTQVSAQEVVEVKEGMSEGTNNALALELPKTDAKTVEKAWTKYLKDLDGKTKKKNKKTGEIFTDNAQIETMSKNTIDIYSKVQSKGEGSRLVVWFDLGGAFLESATHPDQHAIASEMLNDFSANISIAKAEGVLKVEESALDKEEDKLKKLDKDNANMKEKIEDYKKKIKELEAEIVDNEAKRKGQAKNVETQKGKTETARKIVKDMKD
jgi:hypothetical protein